MASSEFNNTLHNLENKEKTNINFYINEKHVTCRTETMETTESLFKQIANIEMKSNKNIAIKLSTATFQFLIKVLLPYFLRKQIKIELTQLKDVFQSLIQNTIHRKHSFFYK